MNRFKGLDLVGYLKNYGYKFVTLYRRQWPKPSQKKKKKQTEERRDAKGKGERKYPTECRIPENSKKR